MDDSIDWDKFWNCFEEMFSMHLNNSIMVAEITCVMGGPYRYYMQNAMNTLYGTYPFYPTSKDLYNYTRKLYAKTLDSN